MNQYQYTFEPHTHNLSASSLKDAEDRAKLAILDSIADELDDEEYDALDSTESWDEFREQLNLLGYVRPSDVELIID
jgi:hypothetical protein